MLRQIGIRVRRFPVKMSTNQVVDGGRTLDGVQDTGVQGVNQWVPTTEFNALNQRIRRLEQRF